MLRTGGVAPGSEHVRRPKAEIIPRAPALGVALLSLVATGLAGCGGTVPTSGPTDDDDDLHLAPHGTDPGAGNDGSGDLGGPDDGGDTGDDGGSIRGEEPEGPTGPRDLPFPSAVLVGLSSSGSGRVQILTLTEDGLSDPGVSVDVPKTPNAIAVAPNGGEAAAAYGLGPSAEHGVVFFQFAADGSDAHATQTVDLDAFTPDSTWSPRDVAYLDGDHVALVMAGPEDENLLFLTRGADGDFTMETRMPSGPAPLQIAAVTSSRMLMLRSDHQGNSAVEPVGHAPDTGDWEVLNRGVLLPSEPIDLALHPSGERAYVPLYDPTMTSDPNRPAILHVLHDTGDDDWELEDEVEVAMGGLTMAVSPTGRYGVLANSVAEAGVYNLVPLELDEHGEVTVPAATPARLDAYIISGLTYGPGDYLVAGYMSSSDTGDYVRVWDATSDLAEVGEAVAVDGSIDAVAIWQ